MIVAIVARHEVPGVMRKWPRPSGTIERISALIRCEHTFPQEYLGFPNDFDPSTAPPGRELSASLLRHFVPGYYHAVPLGQRPFAHPRASH
jgi:hypothetical protein